MTYIQNIDKSVFIADGAKIVGNVKIKADSSVWYNTVIRADIAKVEIGKRSNIQDGSVIHVDTDVPCIIGDDVTIGHGCILHACIIEDGCLIGMGAIVLSGAHIKKGAVVGAGALVKENAVVEKDMLIVGLPGKSIKKIIDSYEKNCHHASEYVKFAKKSREN
jgi:carbonic anhydrase/acetyltransferase-like protein (isoleucine patch superfamily)